MTFDARTPSLNGTKRLPDILLRHFNSVGRHPPELFVAEDCTILDGSGMKDVFSMRDVEEGWISFFS